MSIYLFLLVSIAALVSNTVSLLVSGLIYASLSMLHLLVFGRFDASDYGYYYAAAAAFDCVCAICICMASSCLGKDWHLFPLSLVMVLSMFVNLAGLLIWFFGWDASVYAMAGVSVYLMAALILIGSSFNVGGLLRLDRFGPLHFIADDNGVLLDSREQN